MPTFSKILIFFKARIRWEGICIALWTTLLAPLPIAPNNLISWDAHLYVLSLWSESSIGHEVHFCNPSSLMLYTPYDLLSKLTVRLSDSFKETKNTLEDTLHCIYHTSFQNKSLPYKSHKGQRLIQMKSPFRHQTMAWASSSILPTPPW